MLRALEWCPFLTSQLKSVKYRTHLIGSFLVSPQDKNLSSGVYSARKKKRFNISENELLKDVEIYQKNQIDGLGAL